VEAVEVPLTATVLEVVEVVDTELLVLVHLLYKHHHYLSLLYQELFTL
tara:strand:+ start:231 stop:374 length:144 start_codon:yes stop_codon:yes gene_type:complete